MRAFKTHFDGKNVVVPAEVNDMPPGEVIVIFEDPRESSLIDRDWLKAQESTFQKTWDNDEDAEYDKL